MFSILRFLSIESPDRLTASNVHKNHRKPLIEHTAYNSVLMTWYVQPIIIIVLDWRMEHWNFLWPISPKQTKEVSTSCWKPLTKCETKRSTTCLEKQKTIHNSKVHTEILKLNTKVQWKNYIYDRVHKATHFICMIHTLQQVFTTWLITSWANY